MDIKAQQALSGALEPGERLLWAGVPKQGFQLRAADALLIPFSLLWGGFAIFWEAAVIASKAPAFFALFGAPFVLVGLYLIAGRFVWDAKLRASTVYGLTDQRAIIQSGVFSRTTNSVFLHNLADIAFSVKADGSGTVRLGRPPAFHGWFAGTQWPGSSAYAVPSFELIPQARLVYDQILAARRAAAQRTSG